MAYTADGFQYSQQSGLVTGLPTKAVISSPARFDDQNKTYDVIIIGAGYTGLIACRELALRGYQVLIVEARDRVGGRTFSANFDGQEWDIGGTWMHWTQPHVFSEIHRYGLVEKLKMTKYENQKNAYLTLRLNDGRAVQLTEEEETRIRSKTLNTLFDVDGKQGHLAMPNPHRHDFNKEAFRRFSALSTRERINQVRHHFDEVELAYCEAVCINWCAMDLSKASFFDMMRWYALAGYHPDGITHCGYSYKLECGQTGLTRALFAEVCSFPNVAYTFKNPVGKISRTSNSVQVHTVSGKAYNSRRLICTIPWGVLETIQFEPALPSKWQEVIQKVGPNTGNSLKVYAEVEGSDWDSWSYLTPPGNPQRSWAFAASAGVTPAGNTRMVLFGLRDELHQEIFPQENPEQAVDALTRINPKVKLKRMIWQDWTNDKYAKGVWSMFTTEEAEKCLPVLREPVGPILFANSDWAHAWRGWVDGAVEAGKDAFYQIHAQLQAEKGLKAGRLSARLS